MYNLFINGHKVLKINTFRERLEQADPNSDEVKILFGGKGPLSENKDFNIDLMKDYLLGDNVNLIEIKDMETDEVYFSSDKYRNFDIIQNFLDEEDNIFKIEISSLRA